MNIVLKTASGHTVVRPDTTWEKDNGDLYLPEFVSKISYTPILFVRINKPGRSVLQNFAPRYYDHFNYGILLYPDNPEDKSAESFAEASCLDKTSFLPDPMYNIPVLGGRENEFILERNGEVIYKTGEGNTSMLNKTIADVSERVYLRTGDMVAMELKGSKFLCERRHGTSNVTRIKGTYCDNFLLDFKIFF